MVSEKLRRLITRWERPSKKMFEKILQKLQNSTESEILYPCDSTNYFSLLETSITPNRQEYFEVAVCRKTKKHQSLVVGILVK